MLSGHKVIETLFNDDQKVGIDIKIDSNCVIQDFIA